MINDLKEGYQYFLEIDKNTNQLNIFKLEYDKIIDTISGIEEPSINNTNIGKALGCYGAFLKMDYNQKNNKFVSSIIIKPYGTHDLIYSTPSWLLLEREGEIIRKANSSKELLTSLEGLEISLKLEKSNFIKRFINKSKRG